MKERIFLDLLFVFSITFITVLLCGYFSFVFFTLSYIFLGSYIKIKKNNKKESIKNINDGLIIKNEYKKTYYQNHLYKRSKKLVKKLVKH